MAAADTALLVRSGSAPLVTVGAPLPPLDVADARSLALDRYRYDYGVLLLFALEQEIGERRMRRLLHELLTAGEAFTGREGEFEGKLDPRTYSTLVQAVREMDLWSRSHHTRLLSTLKRRSWFWL